ncbi:dolichol kinase [Apostasia shenzhenica]|uniref:dolichol kinase n=1 Tax=Apostasia shenzhenica TaxID=1088818 RepID=A0A2I0BC84_9ASPA|nr:dolichol kinase [Apostasia shenzhenica]
MVGLPNLCNGERGFCAPRAMVGLPKLCNGERVVVFLFVSRIVFFAPIHLAFEAAALCLLAVASLLTEISLENSAALDRFKTRSGAASGILLASITLPSLMLSRMVQMSRSLPNIEIGPQGFTHFSLHFWAACSGCFTVVCILQFLVQYWRRNMISFQLLWSQAFRFSLVNLVVYGIICSLSFSRKSSSGWYVIMNLIWHFFNGLATIILLKHVLCTFPSCASIGEALLVSSGLVLYFGDVLVRSLLKMTWTSESPNFDFHERGSRSEISTIIQGLLVGLIIFPLFYKATLQVLKLTNIFKANVQVDGWMPKGTGRSIVFYASLLVMVTAVVPAWMHFVEDFPVYPLVWILEFLFEVPLQRIVLCTYWISIILLSIVRFYNISKHNKTERILLRKYYHLVAVLMFVPALIFEPDFLDLAFGTALAVFIVLEMIRVWQILPFGNMVHQFMNAFTDHRDSEILVVSHFSLLLGCAIPKWMSSGFNDRPLAPFAGILSLGIGDTMASMVGHKYGVLRWSKTGKKTIEGTAAGITSVLASCSVLLPLLASTGFILSQHWLSLVMAVTVTGLLEAYTTQLDNAFIPLVFYSLLCL